MFAINWKLNWDRLSVSIDRRSQTIFVNEDRRQPYALSPSVPVFFIEGTIGM